MKSSYIYHIDFTSVVDNKLSNKENKLMKYLLLLSTLALAGCETETEVEHTITIQDEMIDVYLEPEVVVELGFGSEGALENEEPTIEEMLLYAIEDELRAKAEYEMIMDTYDITRPFSNIANSEQTHINLLVPLLEAYEVDYDESEILNHLIEIDSLLEAYQDGFIAEIDNIAMYDLFLTYDLPDDLIQAFTALRDASYNHLAAFERGVSKSS